jgi:hypothetical protein
MIQENVISDLEKLRRRIIDAAACEACCGGLDARMLCRTQMTKEILSFITINATFCPVSIGALAAELRKLYE